MADHELGSRWSIVTVATVCVLLATVAARRLRTRGRHRATCDQASGGAVHGLGSAGGWTSSRLRPGRGNPGSLLTASVTDDSTGRRNPGAVSGERSRERVPGWLAVGRAAAGLARASA